MEISIKLLSTVVVYYKLTRMENSIKDEIHELMREECNRIHPKTQQHNSIMMMDFNYHGDFYNN